MLILFSLRHSYRFNQASDVAARLSAVKVREPAVLINNVITSQSNHAAAAVSNHRNIGIIRESDNQSDTSDSEDNNLVSDTENLLIHRKIDFDRIIIGERSSVSKSDSESDIIYSDDPEHNIITVTNKRNRTEAVPSDLELDESTMPSESDSDAADRTHIINPKSSAVLKKKPRKARPRKMVAKKCSHISIMPYEEGTINGPGAPCCQQYECSSRLDTINNIECITRCRKLYHTPTAKIDQFRCYSR
jgi:hypothetical protein